MKCYAKPAKRAPDLEEYENLPWWFWLLIATGLGTVAAVYVIWKLPGEGSNERPEG